MINWCLAQGRMESNGEIMDQWTGEKNSDLFQSAISNDAYGNPMSFSEVINSVYHEGTIAFHPNGNELVFTRCGDDDGKDDYCSLFISSKNDDGSWSNPIRLAMFDEFANEGHPAYSTTGSRIYFSSDASRGYGGRDLYYSDRTNVGWGFPVNLGSEINTNGDEMYPFILENTTIFFASNGHLGMGGLDMFSSNSIDKKWSNVQNLRSPINSGADDFALVLLESGEEGYFSSTRIGGIGSDDIYFFQVTEIDLDGLVNEPISYVLDITVLENTYLNDDANGSVTGERMLEGAHVEIIGVEKDIAIEKESEVEMIMVPIDEGDYRIVFSKPGYFSKTELVSTKNRFDDGSGEIHIPVSVILQPIVAEQEVVIENIYYDLDKSDIRPDAALELNNLVTLLQENPVVNIQIGAHTDAQGADAYNLDLSSRRAASVVSYLVQNGIRTDRLTSIGYGETQLVNDCVNGAQCSDEEHEENRRTTFKVVGE